MSEVSKKVAEMLLSTESIQVYKDNALCFCFRTHFTGLYRLSQAFIISDRT